MELLIIFPYPEMCEDVDLEHFLYYFWSVIFKSACRHDAGIVDEYGDFSDCTAGLLSYFKYRFPVGNVAPKIKIFCLIIALHIQLS